MTYLESAKIGKFTIRKESPVRAKGKQGIWQVISITARPTGGTAVEVIHTVNAKTRVFDLNDLLYVRPSSKRATLAESHRDNTRKVTKELVPDKPLGRKTPRRRKTA